MYAYTNVGTPYYMSPEQINEEKYNHKSDIWSLGWIIYETASLKPPFQAENCFALALKIREGKFDRIPSHYSDDLQKVIEQMLSIDHNSRPSVKDLLTHPRVIFKINECRLKEKASEIKMREVEVAKREKAVSEKEAQIAEMMSKLEERERKIAELEEKYK